MTTYDIEDRTFGFSIQIVLLINHFPKTPASFAIGQQLIKSGTSIGANVVEAQDAISRKEFIHIMTISLKECREALYWLRLTYEAGLAKTAEVEKLMQECKELRLILASIVRKTKIKQ